MQGLADGYFVIPYTIGGYLAQTSFESVSVGHADVKEALSDADDRARKLLSIQGKRTVDDFHKKLGRILWEYCGMSRNEEGLKKAKKEIQKLREEFWENVLIPGIDKDLNQSLERGGRVADFIDLGALMIEDALARKESCGCHFNDAYQTDDGEAKRNDKDFCHVSAWEYTGDDKAPKHHKESLEFDNVELSQRSYK